MSTQTVDRAADGTQIFRSVTYVIYMWINRFQSNRDMGLCYIGYILRNVHKDHTVHTVYTVLNVHTRTMHTAHTVYTLHITYYMQSVHVVHTVLTVYNTVQKC